MANKMPKTPRVATRSRVKSHMTDSQVTHMVNRYLTDSTRHLWQTANLQKPEHIGLVEYFQPKKMIDIPHRPNTGYKSPPPHMTGFSWNNSMLPYNYEIAADAGTFGSTYVICEETRSILYADRIKRTRCIRVEPRLVHISRCNSTEEVESWKQRVYQYNEIGNLQIVDVWTTGDMAFGTVFGYLVVQIPSIDTHYWSLRHYIAGWQPSVMETTRSAMITSYNAFMPTIPRIKSRIRNAGLPMFLNQLIIKKGLDPSTLTPDMIGILTDQNTGEVKDIVLAPLPPLFKKVPKTFTRSDKEKMQIINLVDLYYPIIAGINKNGEVLFRSEYSIEKLVTWAAVFGIIGFVGYGIYSN